MEHDNQLQKPIFTNPEMKTNDSSALILVCEKKSKDCDWFKIFLELPTESGNTLLYLIKSLIHQKSAFFFNYEIAK